MEIEGHVLGMPLAREGVELADEPRQLEVEPLGVRLRLVVVVQERGNEAVQRVEEPEVGRLRHRELDEPLRSLAALLREVPALRREDLDEPFDEVGEVNRSRK